MDNDFDFFLEYNDSEKAKEIYARFGLCVYAFQVLEHQLMNMLLIKAKSEKIDMTSKEYDDIFYSYSDKTLGKLIEKVVQLYDIPDIKRQKLWNIHQKRNYYVHHYFKDHSEYFFSETKQIKMLEEIISTTDEVSNLDASLEALTQPLMDKINVNETFFKYWHDKLIHGEDIDSLKFKKN